MAAKPKGKTGPRSVIKRTAKKHAGKKAKVYKNEIDPEEVSDISRDIEQGADKEEGAVCRCSEKEEEVDEVERASTLGLEEDEEIEEEEKSGYSDKGIDEDEEGEEK